MTVLSGWAHLLVWQVLPPCVALTLFAAPVAAQGASPPAAAALLPAPPPLSIPSPGAATDQPYAPQPILPGGTVVTLFPAGSSYLKMDRVKEAEVYNMMRGVPGRIQSIVNIHNPSIEFHPADPGINTGAVVILAAGGGHNTLNVGTEGADFVSFFYNYGVNTVILRNRLRRDGYNPQTDAVYDALQAVKMVARARARMESRPDADWDHGVLRRGGACGACRRHVSGIRPHLEHAGRSAGGRELAARFRRAGLSGSDAVRARRQHADSGRTRLRPSSRRPERAMPFMRSGRTSTSSRCSRARIPNIEMHIYGNGVHANGLKDRSGTPFGTWQHRFVDWFRDLGFLAKPGVETKAARDVAARVASPPGRGRGAGEAGSSAGARSGGTP